MNHHTYDLLPIYLALLLMACLVASVGLNVWLVLQPKGLATCNSFGSYGDVLDAFHAGNTALDGDHDGTPCTNRKPTH